MTLVPYHEPVANYRRCYDIPAKKGELFVTIQLNTLPAYDCIGAMDVSLNVSGVESCSHYNTYMVPDMSVFENKTALTECIQTAEGSGSLVSYCQYRCEPGINLVFGWSGSSRLQNGKTICDIKWNYETCWNAWAVFPLSYGNAIPNIEKKAHRFDYRYKCTGWNIMDVLLLTGL